MFRSLVLASLVVALLLGAAAAASANDARITAEKRIGPRWLELTVSTPAFTTPTKVDVDLPAGYDAQPGRRWPVTYVLAGTMNTYRTFNTFVDGLKLTEAYPSIVVSPNGDSGYWSDWYNGGAFGPPRYETYVVRQLIPLIDAHFRTVPDRSRRAVLGISMGGYGSLMIAARHPDLFAAAASLSGAVDSNLPANGAVLSASPEFQGAQPDAIYGPRSTQEVRWHGHNPTDLANNLRGLDLQVRSATGVPNPGIGEKPASADSASCVVEGGVYMASVNLHAALDRLGIFHLWKDYGPGCHTVPNFTRELSDTFAGFAKFFAGPSPAKPASFTYSAIEPAFELWGWRVAVDPRRALEFMHLEHVSERGLTVAGSGTTTFITPALFRGLRRVDLTGAGARSAVPDSAGRIRFTVGLGPPDADQQFTPGANTTQATRTVAFAPHAVIRTTRIHATPRSVRVCARALGGTVAARAVLPGARSARLRLGAAAGCRTLRRTARTPAVTRTLRITGKDGYGHAASVRRTIRLPRR